MINELQRFTFPGGMRQSDGRRFDIDFAADLAKIAGDSITSHTVTATDADGVSANAQVADVIRSGTKVFATITVLTSRAYYLRMHVATALNPSGYTWEIAIATFP